MDNYLELAGRTAAQPSQEPCAMYPKHSVLANDLIDLIIYGQQADLMKRSLFYRQDKDGLQKRADGYKEAAEKMYQRLELLSAKVENNTQFSIPEMNLIHAALGFFSEAAELLENVMGSFLGTQISEQDGTYVDFQNVKEEIGDVQWYAALATRETDAFSLEEIQRANIAKLAKRYPEKFSTENALNRDLEAEKKALTQ